MTTSASNTILREHVAFRECSNTTLEKLEANHTNIEYSVGQSLSTFGLIQNRILIIITGEARLLGHNNNQLTTLARLGKGNMIGLASLLRAEGCEYVSASSPIKAISIPDTIIAEIYANELSFRSWCNQTIFPAEIAHLLEYLIKESVKAPNALSRVFAASLKNAQVISGADCIDTVTDENRCLYVASSNSATPINKLIQNTSELKGSDGVFDLRLISLPKNLVKDLTIDYQNPTTNNNQDNQNFKSQVDVKAKSLSNTGLNLNGVDIKESIDLIKGDGMLQESIACFRMLSQIMNLPFRRDAVERTIRASIQRGREPSLQLLGQLAVRMGLHAVGAHLESNLCVRMNVPCLINWDGTFAIVVRSNSQGILLAHPRLGWIELSQDQVVNQYPEGFDVIMVERTSASQRAKFDLTWFLPAIQKYKNSLIQVLLASFVVQLFTLANPLLIQVIIDKVISQRSLDTLQILGIALVGITIFEGVLGSLRTFLFTDTTNKIDMRLGAEVIDHLLKLPVGYFDKRPVGELGTRIAELEKIRNFLTGEALTTVIDAAFSIIYIGVMALYSWVLTIIALLVVPIQILITLIGAPLFRRQFRQSAEENARTQSHLVEVLTGIQTVKAQNVELVSRWKWQELYSKYISRTFEKTITATAVNQLGQVLQKLSQLMVLWVGATLVLRGELTLGQLIAFRIISGYVTQPLLRLSTIWQRIQELRVSFERLGDIVDTKEESDEIDQGKIPLPPIKGNVEFRDIQFKFNVASPMILKNINLEIESGKFVGIVGQSGSGKSTLMKLIPRLYSPSQGRIFLDGYDIDKVELYSLRRQIGIVPQDPLLFSGSVSENIAQTDPNASSAEITRAATLSCAHEFIMTLSDGYSTQLGERGTNLSGGQRQRLAIARTLLANPKLLVMDEATSALDYDTERRVCQNLREALKGCTVFFVTHRLSTVRNADVIVMMHQGAVVEKGTHDELIDLKGRYYALYRQQEAG